MVTLPVPQAMSSTRAPGSNPIRATKHSASEAPISLAIAPKSPAIQGARIESFIWSTLWCCVFTSFSTPRREARLNATRPQTTAAARLSEVRAEAGCRRKLQKLCSCLNSSRRHRVIHDARLSKHSGEERDQPVARGQPLSRRYHSFSFGVSRAARTPPVTAPVIIARAIRSTLRTPAMHAPPMMTNGIGLNDFKTGHSF
jgi:hypothetical protein